MTAEVRVAPDDSAPLSAIPADLVLHARSRWADIMAKVVDSPRDLATLREWAQWLAASPGTIRNVCRTARMAAKTSLQLARTLRVVVHLRPGMHPSDLLEVADIRTIDRLVSLGRLHAAARPFPTSVDELLTQQQWIADRAALDILRAVLRSRDVMRAPVKTSRF